MKKSVLIQTFSMLMLVLFIGSLNAQVVKTKDKLYKKAVKQRTKQYEKDGFMPLGSGTIQLYVIRGINKEFEEEDGQLKYGVVTTTAVGPTIETASLAARAAARADIAANIETRVAQLIETSLANDQLSQTSANGVNKVVAAGKQFIAQKISLEDIYTLHRPIKDTESGDDIVEMVYSACYSNSLALKKAKQYIREELLKETEELHEDLENFLNWDE